MKVFALLLSLLAVASAKVNSKNAWNLPKALQVRGGAELGPLDGDLAMQLAKAAATAYVAGAGSKYISSQSGAASSQVR